MPDTIDHEIAGDLTDFANGHPILGDAPREHAADHECPGMSRCAVCEEDGEPRYVEAVPVPPARVADEDVLVGSRILGAICGVIIGALLAWWVMA